MNYLETINYGNKILKSQNINSYNLDSELILASVLNSTREEILTNLDKKVDDINFNKYNRLIFRRKNNLSGIMFFYT